MSDARRSDRCNATTAFLDDPLAAGRGERPAILCGDRRLSYAELAARTAQVGRALLRLDVRREERVLLLLPDSPEFVAAFLGAIRIGAVPVPLNTLLSAAEYEHFFEDSRARALVVGTPLLDRIAPLRPRLRHLRHVIAVGEGRPDAIGFDEWIAGEPAELAPADTREDDACFWLYTSGTTGRPRAVIHRQPDMAFAAKHYARRVLGIDEHDRTFSAAKLFFAYGLGNGLYFPLSVGACTVLLPEPAKPEAVWATLERHRPTLFFSVPSGYAALLAAPPPAEARPMDSVRHCVSAGEALPAALWQRWRERWGREILDGIGSTEIVHIFISNRPGRVRPGSSGELVDGYEARILDEHGQPTPVGQVGDLWIKGESICAGYWNRHDATRRTIVGEWIRTGDKYRIDDEGVFWYQGRSDDMLKVSGQWVSPVEVESALIAHPAVLECGVVGATDADGLVKPKAFVVAKPGTEPSARLADELREFAAQRLAPFKTPRWIEFVPELPKTATGKTQRFRLRSSGGEAR